MKNRIIVLDNGVLTHRAIFAKNAQLQLQKEGKLSANAIILPASYTYFSIIISALKKIGVNSEDIIILAGDGRNSWRKAFYPQYKAQRKEHRDSYQDIDWTNEYGLINKVVDQLKIATDWNFVWLSNVLSYADLLFTQEGEKFLIDDGEQDYFEQFGIEADDIIACASKYYKDSEVIIVSIDADLDQLAVYENVKVFSLMAKYKGSKGVYKIINNGYNVLSTKIEKGDKGDNILPGVTDDGSEEACNIRRLIIDLINLPSFVEEKILPYFQNFTKKEVLLEKLPFQKSLANRYMQIYDKTNVITYDECIIRLEKKKKKASQVLKEKREAKKLEKQSLTMRE
jgi:5'-3' exonuclease